MAKQNNGGGAVSIPKGLFSEEESLETRPPKPQYTSRMVWMTPELAASLLKGPNRPLSRVKKYTDRMSMDKWDRDTPQNATAIDMHGNTIDSFQRLNAIVKSKWEGWWRLDENVPPWCRKNYDLGKSRSSGDQLATEFETVGKKGQKYAAYLKIIASLEEGKYQKSTMEGEELNEAFGEWHSNVIKIYDYMPRVHSTVGGSLAWADAIIGEYEEFANLLEQIKTGIGMNPTSKLIRDMSSLEEGKGQGQGTQIVRWVSALKTLRLIEAFMRGEVLTRMPYFKTTGADAVDRIRDSLESL
jgi:hypothetical protein